MKFQPGNKEGRKFTADNQPARRGRKPKLGSIPDEAQDKVYSALYYALSMPDEKTAKEFLDKAAEDLPEFGFLIQIYARGMMGGNAIVYVSDILDRIIGKPRQAQDVTLAPRSTPIQITVGSQEAADGLRHVLATGAQPRDPDPDDQFADDY